MKLPCLFLLLLVTNALCDKKLSLEDIEKEQYHSESSSSSRSSSSSSSGSSNRKASEKSSSETLRAEESRYSAKAEVQPSRQQSPQHQQSPQSSQQHQQQQQPTAASSLHQPHRQQQQYHAPTTSPQELGNQVRDYAELPTYESFKYAAPVQDYDQDRYAPEDDTSAYLQGAADQQQQQYYAQQARSLDYEAQQAQQLYQPEALLGNQLQQQPHQQQKAPPAKYADAADDKGAYYINIPTSQLLAYYQQNYGIGEAKSSKSAEHQQQQQQPISIPVYMPMLTQSQVYAPAKVTYQPEFQYVPAYPKRTQSMFAKPTKASPTVATTAAAAAATSAPAAHQLPSQSQPQYSTQYEYLSHPYQYYTVPQQSQYGSQQAQAQVVFDNPSAAYGDIYNAPAAGYAQDDNSLYDQPQQQQQHHQQQPQYYVSAALAEQLMAQILQQAGLHGTADVVQHAVKQEMQDPAQHFTPPQYQAQKFRSSPEAGDLVPVSAENEGFPAKPLYSSATPTTSQPKTLLDSYVPSHVIAAQDANRERPIKLESGFLPSKINFIRRSYKKRKSD